MEIDPLVGSADYLNDQTGLIKERFVADRRLKEVLVRLDPALEIAFHVERETGDPWATYSPDDNVRLFIRL